MNTSPTLHDDTNGHRNETIAESESIDRATTATPDSGAVPHRHSPRPEEVDGSTPLRPITELPTGFAAMWQSLRFFGFAVVELFSLVWALLCCILSFTLIGLPMLGGANDLLRANAERQRAWALRASGVPVPSRYLPFPEHQGLFGLGTLGRKYTDQTTYRDLLWHLLDPAIGGTMGVFSIGLIGHGIWGIVIAIGYDFLSGFMVPNWYGVIPLTDRNLSFIVGIVGVLEMIAGYLLARPMLRLHGYWTQKMLGTDLSDELRMRVAALKSSRKSTLDMQEAEIERIERDLHDGAQARLVAMGMTINQAANLMEEDPEKARSMLESAKDHSAAALNELRGLVRGIRPPVLADRGLVAAVQALAADTPVPTSVSANLDHRLVPALESALYFAASELIANAVKHSEATHIDIAIGADNGQVQIRVTDNGRGGAEEGERTEGGLAGIRRRLDSFDGELELNSPAGGPTVATVTAPDVTD